MLCEGINYRIDGDGEVVVLIHGLSDTLEYWESFVNCLVDEFRILRYDLRGHGSSISCEDNVSITLFVDDLLSLLDNLGVKRAHIVGFSLGGCVTREFAVRYPDRVSSLVLMSCFVGGCAHVNGVLEDLRSAVLDSFDDFYDLILPMVLCPSVIRDNRDELEIVKEYASGVANISGIVMAIDAMLNFSESHRMIGVPSLVLAGEFDDFIPVPVQKVLSSRIACSEFVVVEGVKHNLLVGGALVEVAGLVRSFIEDC